MAADSIMPTLNDKQRKVHEAFKPFPKGTDTVGVRGHVWLAWRDLAHARVGAGEDGATGQRRREVRQDAAHTRRRMIRALSAISGCVRSSCPYWREPLPEPPPTPAAPVAPAPEEPLPPTNAYLDTAGRLIHNTCAVKGCPNSPAFAVGAVAAQGNTSACITAWNTGVS